MNISSGQLLSQMNKNVAPSFARSLMFGPFGKAEDLNRQIQLPWEVKGTIKKVILKKRKWRGQTIIQGLQLHTREGKARACGMAYNDHFNTVSLDIPEGRYISKVSIGHSAYIHCLSFILDSGEVLGPVGETSNVSQIIVPEDSQDKSMLSAISGFTFQSEKAPVIAQIQFNFNFE